MRRRNHRAETVKKTDSQIGFKFTDPSSSRAHSDLKRRRKVTFDDVDHRSPLNESLESHAGRSLDAKTSEFAFFKKLKSNFGHCSGFSDSKSSNEVKQNPKIFESRPGREYAGTDREANDRSKSYSFSTPIHSVRRGSCGSAMSPVNLTQRDIEKDSGKPSSSFSRDKDTVLSANNMRSGGISDEKGVIFSVKRKKLHQWVKDTWFPESPELNSDGHDLVSALLTWLFPGTEETHPSRFSKERTDRVKRRTFVDSPGSKFLKRSHESYTEVDHTLQMEKDRLISWPGWLENNITPRLQFPTGHVQSSFIPREPKEISFPILYPKESVYRPPLLKQKACLSLPVEETLDCSPISSFHFRNYKPLSLGYQREESRYNSEDLSEEHKEPASAFLLEWNTETANTKKTDDLPLSYHTKIITYPNASSSSLTDNLWSSDYSSSHDLVTRELYPLPLLSHYSSGSFLLPTTNQTSHFEHELERHILMIYMWLLQTRTSKHFIAQIAQIVLPETTHTIIIFPSLQWIIALLKSLDVKYFSHLKLGLIHRLARSLRQQLKNYSNQVWLPQSEDIGIDDFRSCPNYITDELIEGDVDELYDSIRHRLIYMVEMVKDL